MNIEAVDRVCAIIEYLAAHPSGVAIVRLADAVGLAPSTLHRYLGGLRKHGLVEQLDDRTYALTPRLYLLGLASARGSSLEASAQSSLRRLADLSQETVCLMVRDGDQVVCIEQIESGHQLRIEARVGSRSDIRLGSSGRVLLAFAPPQVREEMLARARLERRTPNTVTDPNELRGLLEVIRRDGYYVSRSQVDEGVLAVAAPVRDSSGEVIAAVSVVGPETRLAAEPVLSKTIRLVQDEVAVLSQRLGYAPSFSSSVERSF